MPKLSSKPIVSAEEVEDTDTLAGMFGGLVKRLSIAQAKALFASDIALSNQVNTNPTATDDSADGYIIGSRWVNTTTGEEFVLVDPTAGAAVWKSTTGQAVGNMTTAVYDADDDGIVDLAEMALDLEGVLQAGNSRYYGTSAGGVAGFHSLPAAGNNYHDLAGYYPGVLAASGIVLFFVSVRAMTILSASPGRAVARTAATGSTVFTIQKNGTSVGTFTFAAAETVATWSVASGIVLAPGDTLTVLGPATADATLADVAVSLQATAA